MNIEPLHLDEVHHDEIPTPSQMAADLDSIERFLNRAASLQIAGNDATAADPKIAAMLNAGNLLRQASDQFKGSSPITQPQMRPMPVPTRQ